VQETLAFVDALVNNKEVPCTGEDGLIALVMAIAAGKSAEERRWVKMSEMAGELTGLDSIFSKATMGDLVDRSTGALNLKSLKGPSPGLRKKLGIPLNI